MKRSSAQAHARRARRCRRCGKVCHGNGYANHARACHLHIRYAGNIAWCRLVIGPKTNTVDSEAQAPPSHVCPQCKVRKEQKISPLNEGAMT